MDYSGLRMLVQSFMQLCLPERPPVVRVSQRLIVLEAEIRVVRKRSVGGACSSAHMVIARTSEVSIIVTWIGREMGGVRTGRVGTSKVRCGRGRGLVRAKVLISLIFEILALR